MPFKTDGLVFIDGAANPPLGAKPHSALKVNVQYKEKKY